MFKTATSAQRVSIHTDPATTDRLHRQLEKSLCYHAAHPEQIEQRLRELDEEWDIERVFETNSSVLTLTGLVLGITRGRRWLLLSLAVQGFFLQHALQGWCPPLPLLRRLGFRTQYEIEQERYALKALRGDFREATEPDRVLQAAEA